MSVRQCVSLLALASLLLLQLTAAQIDPAACAENCRFVVVPSLGPAGPAGPPGRDGLNGTAGANGLNGAAGRDGLNGTAGANGLNGAAGRDGLNGTNGTNGTNGAKGDKGDKGDTGNAATLDTSITYSGVKLNSPLITTGALRTTGTTWYFPGTALPDDTIVSANTFTKLTNKKFDHLASNTQLQLNELTPGDGSGTSPDVRFVGPSTMLCGAISVTVGANPLANAPVAILNFREAIGRTYVSLTPGNAKAAQLSGLQQVWVPTAIDPMTTAFAIMSGATPLVATTTYEWTYHIMSSG